MKNSSDEAQRTELLAGLETLRGVPTLRVFHLGTPADTNRPVIDRSYDFSLLAVFDNGADEATYQTHPIHLAFIDRCKHLWERVVVYDSVNA